jgi:hypothetical protein
MALLIVGCAFMFAIVTAMLIAMMSPKRPTEWVAVGTIATLASLGIVFGALMLTGGGPQNLLGKRRVRVVREPRQPE